MMVGMDNVIHFVSRGDRLIEELRTELAATGSIGRSIEQLPVSVQEWRKAARSAARQLGRPVQTIASTDHGMVWARLSDWPANDAEEAIHEQQLRAAMDAVSTNFGAGPSRTP
jgi:hypothetical protein